MPYLPTVNAIAPSTPSGASLMMKYITLKNTCDSWSISRTTGCAGSPRSASAQPNSSENSSTCSTSPLAKAPTTVFGMMRRRKSTAPVLFSLRGAIDVGAERRSVERTRVDVHARARIEEVRDRDTEHQRDRRHDLEVDHRLHADAADLLEVARAADAEDDDAEDDHRDQHLDELDEAVAERLELGGKVGEEHPDRDAEQERDDDLSEERLPERSHLLLLAAPSAPEQSARSGRDGARTDRAGFRRRSLRPCRRHAPWRACADRPRTCRAR